MACDAASRTAALLLMGRDRGLGRHGLRCCQTHVGAAAHWPIVRVEDELAAGVVGVGDARERAVGDDDGVDAAAAPDPSPGLQLAAEPGLAVDMRGLGREPDDSDGVGSRYAPICTNSAAALPTARNSRRSGPGGGGEEEAVELVAAEEAFLAWTASARGSEAPAVGCGHAAENGEARTEW